MTGPLVVDADLVELPLDSLLALDLGSAEPADDLVSNTGFELLKGEAERWHRAASAVQEAVYSLQSEMDKVISIHREAPETVLDETLLPAESGPRSGMSFRELNIRRHSTVLRQQQLRAGASSYGVLAGLGKRHRPCLGGLLARPSACLLYTSPSPRDA